MDKLHIEDTTPEHIDLICDNIREEVAQEMFYDTGVQRENLKYTIHNDHSMIQDQEEYRTLFIDGIPCAIGGIKKYNDPPRIWLIASTFVNDHKMTFLKFMKNHIANWKKNFPTLSCLLWEGNRAHLYWAFKSGGTVKCIEKFGPYQENFYIIEF